LKKKVQGRKKVGACHSHYPGKETTKTKAFLRKKKPGKLADILDSDTEEDEPTSQPRKWVRWVIMVPTAD